MTMKESPVTKDEEVVDMIAKVVSEYFSKPKEERREYARHTLHNFVDKVFGPKRVVGEVTDNQKGKEEEPEDG